MRDALADRLAKILTAFTSIKVGTFVSQLEMFYIAVNVDSSRLRDQSTGFMSCVS